MSAIAQKRIRLAYAAASYLALMLVMVRAAVVSQESASDLLFGAAMAVFVTMACVADSAVIGRPIVFEARLPFAMTWPAALPIYLLRSRGWWGVVILLVILGSLIGTGIGCAAIGVAAAMLMK